MINNTMYLPANNYQLLQIIVSVLKYIKTLNIFCFFFLLKIGGRASHIEINQKVQIKLAQNIFFNLY